MQLKVEMPTIYKQNHPSLTENDSIDPIQCIARVQNYYTTGNKNDNLEIFLKNNKILDEILQEF